jgi:glycogen synthase
VSHLASLSPKRWPEVPLLLQAIYLHFHDLLGGGQYGALFASEDSQSLAKVVIDLLREEDEKRKALAEAGRAHAQRFDWSLVANQVYEIYEKALATPERDSMSHRNPARGIGLLIREND